MKCTLVLCLSLAVLLMATEVQSDGCRYINGKCAAPCPEGTHSYTPGCSPKLPEATCDQPEPVQERGVVCDYSSCYCDAPTVRDLKTGKCVLKEDCTKEE